MPFIFYIVHVLSSLSMDGNRFIVATFVKLLHFDQGRVHGTEGDRGEFESQTHRELWSFARNRSAQVDTRGRGNEKEAGAPGREDGRKDGTWELLQLFVKRQRWSSQLLLQPVDLHFRQGDGRGEGLHPEGG